MRTVAAKRYVTPLREGGSLPAIVEADDDGLYVLKFRGAGQGTRALIAEVIAGELGRALGLPVPEIVFVDLDPTIGRSEPDPEIQELIKASAGLNLAMDYLPGSAGYDPLCTEVESALASDVVWFDALISNVDRTPKNTNLLAWHKRLYLIDHGASLYFHHNWTPEYLARATSPFAAIKDHVLLPCATDLAGADARLAPRLTPEVVRAVVDLLPDEWLADVPLFPDPGAHRAAYVDYLLARLAEPRAFLEEAMRAHARLV
jgi:hypothetical protein